MAVDYDCIFTFMVFLAEHGMDIGVSQVRRTGSELGVNVVRLVETMNLDRTSWHKYKMTSRAIESSSWSSTFQPSTFNPYSPLQMLIIKSLLLTVSFLTLSIESILAVPLLLDARALSLNVDTLFSRGSEEKGKVKPLTSLACT